MACTPLKLVHWDSNIAEHEFGSPCSDTGSSQSQNSTNTVQYVNSQLIAHGFTQPPGLATDGLGKADEERLVKCLLGMLSQRMDDMSRAEDFSARIRTLSYENERLSSMHNSCKEELETAEKNVNMYKSRLNSTTKSLQASQTAHKLTTAELQRTRTTLQSVRQTHAAELKRREKENERMVERWVKLAESQLKIATIPSGVAFHPSHARAQPNAHFWANATVATKDREVVGKGPSLLETALEDAEQARKGLEEENRRVKAVVVECANQLARMLNSVRVRTGRSGEEAPIYTAESMFPVPTANAASECFDSLVNMLRESVFVLCGGNEEDESPSPTPLPRTTTLPSSEARCERQAASDGISSEFERENQKLQEVVDGLRRDIEKVTKQSSTYTGKVSTLFQKLNDDEIDGDVDVGAQRHNHRSTTPPLEDDLHAYLPEADFNDGELDMARSPPRPHRKSVKFRSPKPHRSPARPKAALPLGASSPKGVRSPRRGSGRSVAQVMKSSVSLGSKRTVPAYETEVIPPLFASSSKGAGSSKGFVTSTFVLPPPSPMASLPQRGELLSSFAPTSSKADRDHAAEKELFDCATTKDDAPGLKSHHSGDKNLAGTTQSTTPPTPPEQAPAQQCGVRKFNYPVAKPYAKGMIHAYSPARPSPLSRILMLSESPDSNSGIGTALEDVQEDADEWMDEDELVMKGNPAASPEGSYDEDSPLREKASKQIRPPKGGLHKSRSAATTSTRTSSKEMPTKSIKEKLMGARGVNVAVSSSSRENGKEKGKGKASVSSSVPNQVRNARHREMEKENAHVKMHQQHGTTIRSSKDKDRGKESERAARRPPSVTGHVDGSAPVNSRDTQRTRTTNETAKSTKRSRSKTRLSPPLPLSTEGDPGHMWGSAAGTGVQDTSDPEAKRTQTHARKVSGSSASNANGKHMGGLGTLKGLAGGARRVPIGSADAGPTGLGWR